MGDNSKKPGIRFKGFTDDWEQRKLSEFVDKAVDNRGKTPPIDDNGTHPLIEVAALGGVHPDYSKVEKYLNDDSFKNNLRAYVKEGDILFTTVGSIGLVSLMDSMEEAAIAQNIVAFRAKENFAPEYLYSLFSNEENQYKAKRIVMGAVQPSIKVSQLVDVEYMLTQNVKEQQKIGEYFSNLDHLITLHQRKYDKLVVIKKSMLEKMFPKNGQTKPEIRFSGFTDDWEQRKFSDITFPAGEKNKDNLPLESYSITNEHGFVPQDEKFENGGTMREADKRMYYIVSPNSFAYNPARINVGSIGYQNVGKNVIVSSLYEVFKTSEVVDDRLLWHWFKSPDFQKLIMQLQEGGVRLYFYYDKLCMGEVSLPSLEEQRKIGKLFDTLNNLITLHQRELEKLKKIKLSMLEKMFV